MAVRLTSEENKRLNKIVRNFNSKVTRANTEGKIPRRFLPEQVSAKSLKQNMTSKRALMRELKNLEQFSRKSIRQKARGELTEYEKKVIERDKKYAKEYYQHQYNTLKKVAKPYDIDDQIRLAKYKKYSEALGRDTSTAQTDSLKLMAGGVRGYQQSFAKQGAGYRGFLAEAEAVMNATGIDEDVKEEFFKKIKKLSPQQFYDVYVLSPAVQRVYELMESPPIGKGKMNATKADAREIINTMLEDIDGIIGQVS